MSQDSGFVPADSVTVRDQVAVLARRWRILAICLVVGLGLSVLYVKTRNESYVSNAEVRLVAVTSTPFTSNSTPIGNAIVMPTEQRVATSLTIANGAAKLLGNGMTGTKALSHLSVSVPASSQILNFAYRGATPKAAQEGAAAFERAYMANRLATNNSEISTLRKQLSAERGRLQKQRQKLLDKLARATGTSVVAALNNEITSLTTSLQSNSDALTGLDTVDAAGATLTESPTLPTHPSGTSRNILLALGLGVGLVLGLVAAFLTDALDDHLHGPGDLAALIRGPVLARIPLLRSFFPWRRYDLAAEGTSHPKVAEAYRLLTNRLLVAAREQSVGSVMIASAAQGEGRSSVAANLAASFVDLGCRVWLVSGDLMPPQVHRLFAPGSAPELMSIVPIADQGPPDPQTSSELALGVNDESGGGTGHLTLMATSERELPVGRLMNPLKLIRQVRDNQKAVDLTIIDAPPLLEYADAVPLLPAVDGVIVVADAGATRRSELTELAELLDGTGAKIIGTVLNRDGSRVVSRRARRARHRVSGHQARSYARRTSWSRSSQDVVPSPAKPASPSSPASHRVAADPTFRPNGTPAAERSGFSATDPANPLEPPVAFLRHERTPPSSDMGWPEV
ncbi:MAG TPA: hypothetical protein VME70_02775 [Mycobacteriales bacterium]|nr:hypothetical protein [Mycobacteriales bacterium]